MNSIIQKRINAFTLLELMMVVAAVVAVGFVFLPALAKPKCGGRQDINCVNNLKQVGLSFLLWAGDNGEKLQWRLPLPLAGRFSKLQLLTELARLTPIKSFKSCRMSWERPKL